MTLAVDLHIHSCLSPCADDSMTPHNLTMMAHLKGLDAIAVCDHNACLNGRACARAGEHNGVLVVPGVEATTAEEVHALCYFPHWEAAEDFCALLAAHQPVLANRPDLFGEQLILDERDNEVGRCSRWLGQPVALGLDEMEREARRRGGVLVPAHINRPSNSVLANLGFLPPSLLGHTVEVIGSFAPPSGLRAIRSSDAHDLGSLLEPGFPLEVTACTAQAIVDALLAPTL